MKPAMYIRVLPLVGIFALSMVHAETVDQKLKALPEAVKKTISAESPQGGVVTIEPKTMEGAMRYKIGVQDHGKSRTLVIEATGKLLVTKTEVASETLPAPVHKTLDAQIQGAKVEKISQVNKSVVVPPPGSLSGHVKPAGATGQFSVPLRSFSHTPPESSRVQVSELTCLSVAMESQVITLVYCV